ncbi:MAG: hypothetical protein IPM54_37115 [Polyangiaceae bacterium]|nr:hypothetical protein [Polyangiaceae bacterium]
MTAVFHRLGAKGYEMINTVNGYDDDEVLRDLYGPPRKQDWKPILVRRCRPSRREAFKAADLPYDHDVLILRPSAVDALRDILETHGEVLPLATEDGVELFVFNPRFVIDAFDRERSTYEQIPGTSTLWIRKYVFIESAIREIDIFKMPMDRGDYYSDRFVERVKAAKLKGTEFIKLWSSNDTV